MYHCASPLGEVELSMIGAFNISNAVAAISCAVECGIPFSDCAAALRTFSGIGRRLEHIGDVSGRPVYYDYAHHPTEIREGIKAVKCDTGMPVTVIFGPHTYSRTEKLWGDFVSALGEADHVILTEIDAIREPSREGVSSSALARECGGVLADDAARLVNALAESEGAIVIMGAANMDWVKNTILNIDKCSPK